MVKKLRPQIKAQVPPQAITSKFSPLKSPYPQNANRNQSCQTKDKAKAKGKVAHGALTLKVHPQAPLQIMPPLWLLCSPPSMQPLA